jgi:hypothetical protein
MRPLICVAAAALLAACSSSSSEVQISDLAVSGLSVTAEKTTYSAADINAGEDGVRATLTAATDQPFYARLGDAFNGAVDQNPIYLAAGTDGTAERQSGSTWVAAESGILVEGVREVVLSPGKTYTMLATLARPVQSGTYRLRVSVRDQSGGNVTRTVVSPTFQIR